MRPHDYSVSDQYNQHYKLHDVVSWTIYDTDSEWTRKATINAQALSSSKTLMSFELIIRTEVPQPVKPISLQYLHSLQCIMIPVVSDGRKSDIQPIFPPLQQLINIVRCPELRSLTLRQSRAFGADFWMWCCYLGFPVLSRSLVSSSMAG